MAPAVCRYQDMWKKLALAIIQMFRNLQVKEQRMRIMLTLTSCGRFPVSFFRFPASTLNIGRGFVHLLCLEVLAGSLCLLAQRINNIK